MTAGRHPPGPLSIQTEEQPRTEAPPNRHQRRVESRKVIAQNRKIFHAWRVKRLREGKTATLAEYRAQVAELVAQGNEIVGRK